MQCVAVLAPVDPLSDEGASTLSEELELAPGLTGVAPATGGVADTVASGVSTLLSGTAEVFTASMQLAPQENSCMLTSLCRPPGVRPS